LKDTKDGTTFSLSWNVYLVFHLFYLLEYISYWSLRWLPRAVDSPLLAQLTVLKH
jgi:hypothetical protein